MTKEVVMTQEDRDSKAREKRLRRRAENRRFTLHRVRPHEHSWLKQYQRSPMDWYYLIEHQHDTFRGAGTLDWVEAFLDEQPREWGRV